MAAVLPAVGMGLFGVVAGPAVAAADTTIGAGELGGQVWRAADGPYHVQLPTSGILSVSAGKELRIEAGTVVLFSTPARLDVSGTIRIQGTSAAPVTFQSEPGSGATWAGIWVMPGAVAEIDGAIIRDGTFGLWFYRSSARVQRTIIENCGIAVTVEDGAATLDSVILRNNRTGLDLEGGSQTENPSAILTNALVQSNRGRGALVLASTLTAINCTFADNGIAVDAWAGYGLSARVDLQNSIIARSTTALNLDTSPAQPPGTIALSVSYSTFWDNKANLRDHPLGGPITTLGPSEVPAGMGNLAADPGFAGATDPRPVPGSSSIDTGNESRAPDHDLAGNARPSGAGVDRGAYELVSSSGGLGGEGGGATGGRAPNQGGSTGGTGAGGASAGNGGDPATGGGGEGGGTGGGAGNGRPATGSPAGGCSCAVLSDHPGGSSLLTIVFLAVTACLSRRNRHQRSGGAA